MTWVRPLVTNFKMTVRAESDQFLSAKYKEIEEHTRMGKLEISSRKLEISTREHFMQRWVESKIGMVGT